MTTTTQTPKTQTAQAQTARTTKRRLASLAAGTLILLTTACTGTTSTPESPASAGEGSSTGLERVILIGDSVAEGLSLPLGAAFGAGQVEFQSLAADGGGAVVGPVSEEVWKDLPQEIAAAKPSAVIYQITTYDWGSEQEQKAAYERLLTTVAEAGAKLVIVTMPPIKPDDFYRPHLKELNHTARAARAVADASDGKAVVLDASEVWGSIYQRSRNGKVDRSSDGIHACPQGAARFTNWMMDEMATLYPAFTPPTAKEWANTGWSGDRRFTGC